VEKPEPLRKTGTFYLIDGTKYTIYGIERRRVAWHCSPMTPEDAIDDLYHKAALAVDESEFDAVLADLRSALRENYDYLHSVSAEYLLTLPLVVRKRVNRLHDLAG